LFGSSNTEEFISEVIDFREFAFSEGAKEIDQDWPDTRAIM
jgi:hypothetical protein